MDEAQRISAFWRWWQQHALTLAQLLDDGLEQSAMETYAPQLEHRLQEVDPRLGYRINATTGRSRRTLTISAHGQQWMMPLARRVRDAAPPPDQHWSYTDFIQRSATVMEMEFNVGGLLIGLSEARMTLTDLARKVDVQLWHPQLEHFPAQQAASVATAMLDEALGEEVVECWVGEVEVLADEPDGAGDLLALRSYVDDVRSRFVEMPDTPPWTTVEGTRYDGTDVHARVRVPVCVAREPLLEKVVTIRLHLEDPTASPHADALEERIIEAIGADGELTAVETLGETRTWYCYVRPDTGAAQRLLELARAEGLPAEAANDPTWEVVSHLS